MEPLIYVMAILGCGESDAPCREVTVAEARYRSETECVAATEAELLARDDLLFPSVVAQCRPDGSRPQLLRGIDVALPHPDAGRHAPPRLASAEPRRDRF
jgi:hypothetical protein